MAVSPHFPSVSRVRFPLPAAAAMLNVDYLKLYPSTYIPALTPSSVLDVVWDHQQCTVPQVLPIPAPSPPPLTPPGICIHARTRLQNLTLSQDDESDFAGAVWVAVLSEEDLRV